jgi:acyl-phosphate glycerol 3-phosphate acyltransferase
VWAAAVLAAYLIGSLSFAVIVSRLMGLNDPRSYGSKNPGATNVLRSGNKLAAVATLLLDAIKGWLPMALLQWRLRQACQCQALWRRSDRKRDCWKWYWTR